MTTSKVINWLLEKLADVVCKNECALNVIKKCLDLIGYSRRSENGKMIKALCLILHACLLYFIYFFLLAEVAHSERNKVAPVNAR